MKIISSTYQAGLMLLLIVGPSFADTPAANPSYVIHGDTVYDKNTNLTWARCSVGQKWKEGIGCEGTVSMLNFDTVEQQGGGGWRVPTKEELMTLLDYNQSGLKIDAVTFPDMDGSVSSYWTSTAPVHQCGVCAAMHLSAWRVDFRRGYIYVKPDTTYGAVRLVRSGK